ncbi:MAG: diaminopimelate epimerase [Candidatus Puniceispirillaceae bacterium]
MTEFLKMHGLGNDFIIFDWRDSGPPSIGEAAARRLADRRLGIGCDQILVIRDSATADIRMDILNHDGSPSGACGNGTRCVADFVMRQAGRDDLTIETDGGQLRAWHADDEQIAVDMGPVATGWREVPLAREADTLHVPLGVELGIEELGDATCHSLGNPHAVVFVEDAEAVDLARLGPMAEHAPLFPDRVNLSVVSRIDDSSFRMRVWERGVGITMACGSGACAVGVAIVRRGLGPRSNRIVMDGGSVQIDWDETGRHVIMTGPVAYVCHGTLSPELESLMEQGHGAS